MQQNGTCVYLLTNLWKLSLKIAKQLVFVQIKYFLSKFQYQMLFRDFYVATAADAAADDDGIW